MAKVEIKAPVVEEISSVVKDAAGVVLVDYRGLNVAEDTALRRQLREAGVTYKVFKNTMMSRAFEGTDLESLIPNLEGPNAIAVSKDDATAPARILAKFAKTAPKLEIKCGVVEGTFYDANGMQQVASIPPREELISRLLGSMKSPISNLARVLNQIAEKGGADACTPAEKTEEAPVEEAPAAEAPAAEAPAEEAPAAEAPAEEAAPAEAEAPAEEAAPAEETPAEEA